MSRVAYCSKCYRIVLANEIAGFDTCPYCKQKYKFTEINQHSWYLMTAEQRSQYKAKWFGTEHLSANDTVRSFNEETGQEMPQTPVPRQAQVHAQAQPQVQVPTQPQIVNVVDDNPIIESTFPMTKGESFEGHHIQDYLGVVTSTCALSVNALSNIDQTRQNSMDEIRRKCSELGANAAVCVSVDTQVSDKYVIMTTSGTAVII